MAGACVVAEKDSERGGRDQSTKGLICWIFIQQEMRGCWNNTIRTVFLNSPSDSEMEGVLEQIETGGMGYSEKAFALSKGVERG